MTRILVMDLASGKRIIGEVERDLDDGHYTKVRNPRLFDYLHHDTLNATTVQFQHYDDVDKCDIVYTKVLNYAEPDPDLADLYRNHLDEKIS